MKYNTATHLNAHLLPTWNELIDIDLNLPVQSLNDMKIIFKVVDECNYEIIG
jgi:hypothetical protein